MNTKFIKLTSSTDREILHVNTANILLLHRVENETVIRFTEGFFRVVLETPEQIQGLMGKRDAATEGLIVDKILFKSLLICALIIIIKPFR